MKPFLLPLQTGGEQILPGGKKKIEGRKKLDHMLITVVLELTVIKDRRCNIHKRERERDGEMVSTRHLRSLGLKASSLLEKESRRLVYCSALHPNTLLQYLMNHPRLKVSKCLPNPNPNPKQPTHQPTFRKPHHQYLQRYHGPLSALSSPHPLSTFPPKSRTRST